MVLNHRIELCFHPYQGCVIPIYEESIEFGPTDWNRTSASNLRRVSANSISSEIVEPLERIELSSPGLEDLVPFHRQWY